MLWASAAPAPAAGAVRMAMAADSDASAQAPSEPPRPNAPIFAEPVHPAVPAKPPAASDEAAKPAPAPAAPAAPPAVGRGRLRGEVGFSRREKLTGAMVVLLRESDPSWMGLTASGASGVFNAEGIPEGSYRIFVFRDGARPAIEKGFLVRGPFRAQADLTVQKATPGAPPPPSAAAASASTDDPVIDLVAIGAESPSAVPGGAAAAAFPQNAEKFKPAVAAAAGSGPSDVTGKITGTTVLAPPDAGTLRIVLRHMGGSPVSEGRLVLRRVGGGVDPLRITLTRPVIEVPLPPAGTWTLTLESPGTITMRVPRIVIGDGPLTLQAFLVPRPSGYLGSPEDLLPDELPLPPPALRAAGAGGAS